MNEVFVIGKVISEVEFKFVYQSKRTSVANFIVELFNKSIVEVVGYDEMADYMYRNIQMKDKVFINGKINSEMKVVALGMEILPYKNFHVNQ